MSFKKRAPKTSTGCNLAAEDSTPALPPGVRASLSSGALLPVTSWGLQGIDFALGGGLPLGSLTLVIEDEPSAYHIPLLSYVTAQGIEAGHAVAIVAFDIPADDIVDCLPARAARQLPAERSGGVRGIERRGAPRMDIAWRYQKNADPSTHLVSGDGGRSFAYDFDLSQNMEIPNTAAVSRIGYGISRSLDEVLEHLQAHLDKAARLKLLSRIVIHGLSPTVAEGKDDIPEVIPRFLGRVRAFTRIYGAVAVVSCARGLPERTASIASDAMLKLDSFEGQGAGVAGLGKEWLGVLIVKKTFRDARGVSLRGKGDVWVFKRGRRKYIMERATAAPDEEDVADDLSENKSDIGRELGSNGGDESIRRSVCGVRPLSSSFDF